jgi:hypothetical protein
MSFPHVSIDAYLTSADTWCASHCLCSSAPTHRFQITRTYCIYKPRPHSKSTRRCAPNRKETNRSRTSGNVIQGSRNIAVFFFFLFLFLKRVSYPRYFSPLLDPQRRETRGLPPPCFCPQPVPLVDNDMYHTKQSHRQHTHPSIPSLSKTENGPNHLTQITFPIRTDPETLFSPSLQKLNVAHPHWLTHAAGPRIFYKARIFT